MAWTRVAYAVLIAGALVMTGCSCDDDADAGGDGGNVNGDGGNGLPDGWISINDGQVKLGDGSVVITEDGGYQWVCRTVTCEGKMLECGDCIDNDGDGVIDSRDRECLGPCDNTEGPALTAGVGGEGGNSCNRDCYFDFGNGAGNDECRWDTSCDPLEPDAVCPYSQADVDFGADKTYGGGTRCPGSQGEMCLNTCRPITPNGCDCFGCCTFEGIKDRAEGDGGAWVWLGSGIGEGEDGEGTCTFDDINDTELCKPCIPVDDCFNDCRRCELCLGKTELPPDCVSTPPDASVPDGSVPDASVPEARCAAGEQVCGLPGEAPCNEGFYCITGCCKPILR